MKIVCLLFVFLFATCFSHAFDELLQTKLRDVKFAELLTEIDFNTLSFKVEYRVGTTSVGLKIIKKGKQVAYWYPEGNVSAQPEGQVVSYYLGRFLNMSELVAPSEYYSISGRPIEQLIEFLESDKSDQNDEFKQLSKSEVLKRARNSVKTGEPVPGVISWKLSNFEPYELVDWENNRFNVDHPIAKMIRADEPQPSSEAVLDLPDFVPEKNEINTSTEKDLARELSQIMVLDMLTGQQDRFTGGNLEARFEKSEEDPKVGRLHFLMRDNGLAFMDEGGVSGPEFQKYLSIVTRFDRAQIERVHLLKTMLEEDSKEVQRMLRMTSNVDLLWERASTVLEHVNREIKKHGEDAVFFKD